MNAHIPPNSGAGMRSEVPVNGFAADWGKKGNDPEEMLSERNINANVSVEGKIVQLVKIELCFASSLTKNCE